MFIFLIWALIKSNRFRISAQKSKVKQERDVRAAPFVGVRTETPRKRKLRAPKDPVRQELYQLEKRLNKTPYARMTNDTVNTWLKRLPGSDMEKSIISSIYEKVRYGYKHITSHEWESYRLSLDSVRTALNEQKR
ncbi:MAG: hypothetical protein ACO1OC_04990 [Tuberibacillus sp.]